MAVFEYGTQNDEITSQLVEDPESVANDIRMIDGDTKTVSVVDQGNGDYTVLRSTIPKDFADELGIEKEDELMVKLIDGVGLMVVKP